MLLSGITKYQFNNVSVLSDGLASSYVNIIRDHYSGPEYDDTLFVLTFEDLYGNCVEIDRCYKKIIFCNFEHIDKQYDNRLDNLYRAIFEWVRNNNITEIWEWQYDCIKYYPEDLKPIVKFMPVRYCNGYETIPRYDYYKYSYAFIGTLTERKRELVAGHSFYAPFVCLSGYTIPELYEELSTARMVLNVHDAGVTHQEQLRIFELMCMDVPVLSERSVINYFPGLIIESDDIYSVLYESQIPTQEFDDKYNINNLAHRYKEMTYTDEAFEVYKNNIIKSYNG